MSLLGKRIEIKNLKKEKNKCKEQKIEIEYRINYIERNISELEMEIKKEEEAIFNKKAKDFFAIYHDIKTLNKPFIPSIIELNIDKSTQWMENFKTKYVYIYKLLEMELYKQEMKLCIERNINHTNFKQQVLDSLKTEPVTIVKKICQVDPQVIMYSDISHLNISKHNIQKYIEKANMRILSFDILLNHECIKEYWIFSVKTKQNRLYLEEIDYNTF